MPDFVMVQLKAIVAALVAAGATWVTKKTGVDFGPEAQGVLIGLIMYAAVYLTPKNKAS